MEHCFAPMEGITTAAFRRVHHARFPGADRYYTPFYSPTCDHVFTPRDFRELLPENNAGIPVVPQLLSKNAEDILWAIRGLADMGYEEVDLNLGCPSATVTAKGKGSGLLLHIEALDALLEQVFSHTPVPVSVKTRIGYHSAEEWPRLLDIYNRYPLARLTVHPRTRKEMYAGTVHREALDYAAAHSRAPLCFNGDLFTAADIRQSEADYPTVKSRMAGRGAVTDPALFRRLNGGAALTREELKDFHEELYDAYRSWLDPLNAMRRMKELWSLLIDLFEKNGEHRKQLARAKTSRQFDGAVASVFAELEMREPGSEVRNQRQSITIRV